MLKHKTPNTNTITIKKQNNELLKILLETCKEYGVELRVPKPKEKEGTQMKISVCFTCEVSDIEIDNKFRKLCHAYVSDEEEMADAPLFDELVENVENQLSALGFNVYSIDSIESSDGWLLYED